MFAGEITGNGTLKTSRDGPTARSRARKICSGTPTTATRRLQLVATKGDPGHAQSWGQIPKAVRDRATAIGLNPGIACNPNKSTFGE